MYHPGMFELPYTANAPGGMNGRVNLAASKGVSAGGSFTVPGFQHSIESEKQFQADMLRGNWQETDVSRAFFSASNLKTIQNLIRREVYEKSGAKGYVIDDQSVDELKIIMRAIYLQYGRNLPTNIPDQVNELNQRVADWSVPHILSAVDHYFYYLDDISHLPVPIAHAVNVSRSGTKTLPTNQFM